jgi:hypothetical protein
MAKKKTKKRGKEIKNSINKKQKIVKEGDKYSRQTKIALIIMFLLIAGVFFVRWIINERREIEYKDMTFYKVDEGGLIFYKAPLGFVSAEGINAQFILKLRNNPKGAL